MVHSRRVTVTRAPSGLEFSGEAFDVGAADLEQRERAGTAPGGELAQVQGVRLASQAPVPGQEPGEGEPFGIGERWLDGDEGSGCGCHRVPPGPAETGEARPDAASATIRPSPTSRPVRHVMSPSAKGRAKHCAANVPDRRLGAVDEPGRLSGWPARIIHYRVHR